MREEGEGQSKGESGKKARRLASAAERESGSEGWVRLPTDTHGSKETMSLTGPGPTAQTAPVTSRMQDPQPFLLFLVLLLFWFFFVLVFFFLMRHNSSLVCMVGITYMYIAFIFAFGGYFLFITHLYCIVGCSSMIVWTHAVLGVLYAYA